MEFSISLKSLVHKDSPDQLIRTYDAEKRLMSIRDIYSLIFILIGWTSAVVFTYWSTSAFLAVIPMTMVLKQVQDVEAVRKRQERGRLHEERIANALIDRFKERGIEVFSRVYIDPSQDLDLFIRFPDKQLFAISVMALGEGNVIFNEKNETLCFRRKNTSLDRYDNPDPIKELKDQEWWLRKNRRDLFGGSSRDSRRPLTKIIVFAQPSQIKEHNEHLYATMGDQRFLRVSKEKMSAYVLQEDQIVNFIQAHLD
jgi:Nuclease-related domain